MNLFFENLMEAIERDQQGEGPAGCREPAQFLLKSQQETIDGAWTGLEINIWDSPA